MRLGSWGRAEFGWVHAALELGAREVWMLDGWHAAQELGARGFGWLARGSGAGGPRSLDGGTRLWRWARGVWLLDGWRTAQDAAQELGVRGVCMGGAGGPDAGTRRGWVMGTRLWSWGSAEFGWVACSCGDGGPRSLDGWHAAQELGGPRTLDGWHTRSLDGWHGAGARGPIASSFASTQHQICSKFARRAIRMH